MPKFEPQFVIKPLDQVSPGALVMYKHAAAFAGVNRSAPAAIVTLAVHDTGSGRFVYHYFDAGQPNVLVPGGGEYIIRPKLDTLAENVPVKATSAALFIKDEPYIVVDLPDAPDFRLLNVKNGSLVRATVSEMDAFTSWEAGVMSLGEFLPLLQI